MNTDNMNPEMMQGPPEPDMDEGGGVVVVESIEGDMATVTMDGQTMRVPLEALPQGVREGDQIDPKTGEIVEGEPDMDEMPMGEEPMV